MARKRSLLDAAIDAESRRLKAGQGDPEAKGDPCRYCSRPVSVKGRKSHSVCRKKALKEAK